MKNENSQSRPIEQKEDCQDPGNTQKKRVFKKRKHWHIWPEIRDNRYLFDESDLGHVVDERFEVCLAWYIKNATFYKYVYHSLMLVSCICPLVAALISQSGSSELTKWVGILSVGASISTAVLSQLRAQEKWTEYRSAAEFLKSKRALYLAGLQENGEDREKQREFLVLIEEYMEKENSRWKDIATGVQNDLTTIE